MIKYFIFLIILLVQPCVAQTSNLGEPFTFKEKIIKTKDFYVCPSVNNNEEIDKEVNRVALSRDKMLRFGTEHSVSIDFFENAMKTVLPNGDLLYQYGIACKTAISINLIFDRFQLVQGAHLYLSDPSKKKFDGAYTSLNNNPSQMLGTELVYSEQIIVEVFVPAGKEGMSQLNIGTIVHGYRNLNQMVKALNSSGSCEIDVNCPLGEGWENQRNSVAMMVNGGGFCTGSLINNTSGTIIPYFLTANHCGTNPGGWVFRFKYESPEDQADCGTTSPSVDGPTTMNINGGTLKANSSASDFNLTLLTSAPDPSWGIFYNGWDRTNFAATQLTGIHHPSGDVKKISRDESDAVSSTFGNGSPNTHWRVPSWDQGVTEPGSSGSPLFNQEHRIIGQLHGGASSCGASPSNLNDDYGKIFISWTGGGTSSSRLSDWLDPGNVGSLFIDGVDPNTPTLADDTGLSNAFVEFENLCGGTLTPQVEIYNSGSNTLTSATIAYGYDGTYNQTINWTGSLASFATETILLPTTSLTGGNHNFKSFLTSTSGTDLNLLNDTTNFIFTTITNGEIVYLNLTINCYSNENSWVVTDELSQQIFATSVPYNNSTPVPILDSFCLAEECYIFKLSDNFGDGITGNTTGCANGSFTLTNSLGITLYTLPSSEAAFGSLVLAPFCLGDAGIENAAHFNALKIYPNPANSQVYIDLGNEVFNHVKITTVIGQNVYENFTEANNSVIDVSNLAKGVYTVQISNEKATVSKQLIIN